MKILNFIFILCLVAGVSFGQEPQKKIKPKRTDNFIRMKGIRVGMDLSRPFQKYWNNGDRYGSELSFDMELCPNLFPVFETGWEKLKIDQASVKYNSTGPYSRFGIDYNLLVAETPKDKDILIAGLRYGFTLGNQQVERYTIDSYWGTENHGFPQQNYFAHWGEILLGIKGEIVKNIYMGWTVRGKVKLNSKEYTMPPVFFIPGYGRASRGFNMDFTYSIYYNLPFGFKGLGNGK